MAVVELQVLHHHFQEDLVVLVVAVMVQDQLLAALEDLMDQMEHNQELQLTYLELDKELQQLHQ
jgi:hypothetical protein